MEPAIHISNLSVTLDRQVEVLKNIQMELPAGKLIGFIGPSGAGKTTLIRCIIGSLKVPKDSVVVLGKPAGSKDLRRNIGYMAQNLSVYSDLTVLENLQYFGTMIGIPRAEAKPRINNILETVDLIEKTDDLVSDLSGGQRQRVSLAVALLGDPKLLVLDEPTVGLDPALRVRLWDLFARLATQGRTLIISSHSMDEAERCDDLVLLRDGAVIAHSSPEALKQQTGTHSIEQSFLQLVGEKK